MPYCVQSDIEDLFGITNVAVWSNLENDEATVDAARVAKAIAFADGVINGRFRSTKYTTPLQAISDGALVLIKDAAARLAGAWLYESRGSRETNVDGFPVNRLSMHRKMAMETIERYVSGQDVLDASTLSLSGSAPFVGDC